MRCAAVAAASDAAQLKAAREDIRELLRATHCHPILVRTVTPPPCSEIPLNQIILVYVLWKAWDVAKQFATLPSHCDSRRRDTLNYDPIVCACAEIIIGHISCDLLLC